MIEKRTIIKEVYEMTCDRCGAKYSEFQVNGYQRDQFYTEEELKECAERDGWNSGLCDHCNHMYEKGEIKMTRYIKESKKEDKRYTTVANPDDHIYITDNETGEVIVINRGYEDLP